MKITDIKLNPKVLKNGIPYEVPELETA